MKRRVLTVVVGVVLALGTTGLAPASAIGKYANCDAMHHQHKYGVAKNQAAANKQVNTGHYRPFVKRSLYLANSNLDRDHDLTACEVSR